MRQLDDEISGGHYNLNCRVFDLVCVAGLFIYWPILRFGDDSMTQFRLSDLFVCEKDEFSYSFPHLIFLKESFTDYTLFDDEIDVLFQFAKKYFDSGFI